MKNNINDSGKNSDSDLGKFQELFAAVQHLTNIEDHLYQTAMETGKEEYLVMHQSIRKLRAKYLKMLMTNTEGNLWCIGKHLCAVTYRLKECASKWQDAKDINTSKIMLEDSKELTALFYYLNSSKEGTQNGKDGQKDL